MSALRGLAGMGSVVTLPAGCAASTADGPVRGGGERTGGRRVRRHPSGRPAGAASGPWSYPTPRGQSYDLRENTAGVTALFFGYTQCPDICPTTMADLAAAKRDLPAADQERVTVIFVTEDPPSDTAGGIRQWLDRFDEDFIGLVGGDANTDRVLEHLHLPQTEGHVASPDGPPHEDGELEHSGVVYLFGPDDGRPSCTAEAPRSRNTPVACVTAHRGVLGSLASRYRPAAEAWSLFQTWSGRPDASPGASRRPAVTTAVERFTAVRPRLQRYSSRSAPCSVVSVGSCFSGRPG